MTAYWPVATGVRTGRAPALPLIATFSPYEREKVERASLRHSGSFASIPPTCSSTGLASAPDIIIALECVVMSFQQSLLLGSPARDPYACPYPGEIIFSGRTIASKSSAGTPSAMASSRRVVPFLWAVLAILAARS